MTASDSTLDAYLEFLYGGLEGYIYLAAKDPTNPDVWRQEFCHWPTEANKAKNIITNGSNKFEIYIGPALYTEPKDAKRHNIKVTNVVWTEFDGNAPESWEDGYEPSLILRSSSDKNQHVYWRLNEPLFIVDEIEDINRRLTYNLQADSSAWDATQVLRPPETYNHKRGTSTSIVHLNDTSYDVDIFNSLAPAPEQIEAGEWKLASLPDVQEVILRYSFTEDMVQLFKKGKDEVEKGTRSTALMNLAYGLCQMGMSDIEVFVLLLNADDRWEKFKGRKDREKRLLHIITVARNKYPDETEDQDEQFTYALGFQSFLNTEIELDWAIEPMLMDAGFMLMAGPPGIGKTQISLQFMIHLALGKDFLHYKIPEPKKIAFLSLEMGHGELKVFLKQMNEVLSDAERALLEENFIIVPHGEAWALNTSAGQEQLNTLLDAIQPYGLFVDSIGSAIIGNISSDETVQPLLNYIDRLRKTRKLFVWCIHHTRKHERGGSGNYSQDDIYGNQYLAARPSSLYGVLPGKGGTIKMRSFKVRLAAKESDFLLERKDHLTFHKVSEAVDKMIDNNLNSGDKTDKAPGGFDL